MPASPALSAFGAPELERIVSGFSGSITSVKPNPRASVVSRLIGQEMVLVDSQSGKVHVLNPTAALVWQCFDGESSAEEIVADLAEGFGVQVEAVREDVLTMIASLASSGLLEGVEEQELELATRIGLPEGTPVRLSGWRGRESQPTARRALLVHWSSTCGFCTGMLPGLAFAQAALDDAGVDVVLLDAGEIVETHKLLDQHGVGAQVLAHEESPFAGMGTPVAYLLDEDSRVASPLAYGAHDVLILAANVAGNGPNGKDHPARILPAATGVCGPTSSSSPIRMWERTRAYSIGDYVVGIRGDSHRTEEMLARFLGENRLPEGTYAPDNFSVVLEAEGSERGRELNVVMRDGQVVARSHSPRRALAALAGHLTCLLGPEPGLTRVDGVGAVFGETALILPRVALAWLSHVQPVLARLGIALVDEPYAHVDLSSLELVVSEPRIEVARSVLRELADPDLGPSEPAAVLPGRYELRSWFIHSWSGHEGELSDAASIAGVLGALVARPDQMPDLLRKVMGMAPHLRTTAIAARSSREFCRALHDNLKAGVI